MKDKIELLKPTSLETTADVKECLSWKITRLTEEGKNVSTGLADYLYLGVDNLEKQLSQLKELEAEIKARKSAINGQITAIKTEGALFLKDNGIEKLEGVLTSSVTVTKEKPAGAKKRLTLLVPKAESEKFLVESGLAVYESVEVPPTPSMIKINKRRVHVPEVEDGQ